MSLLIVVVVIAVTLSISQGWAVDNRTADDNRRMTLLTSALGGSSASWAYSSCGYIGATADGYAAGLYTDEQIITRMGFMMDVLKKHKSQLEQLDKEVNLGSEDEKFIKQLIQTLEALVQQSQGLVGYASSRKPQHLKTFHEARIKAWQLTTKILGMSKAFADQRAPGGAKLGK